jgi:RNA polymerase sigma-70 factor (ECF subfamily)
MSDSPERWLEDHGGALYAYALRHLRDPQRAEEAVQETLLAALESRGRFAGRSSVRTWLIGILKHKVIDELRRGLRAPLPTDDPADENFDASGRWRVPPADWGDPERALAQQEFWRALERCLDTLPPRLAQLYLLRDIWEVQTDELCKELAITTTNLWTTLHRTRLALRRCLERTWLGGGET